MNRLLFCIVLLVLLQSCEKDHTRLNSANGPDVSDVLKIGLPQGDSLPADSASSLRIVIQSTNRADSGVSVSLTTDRGTFTNGTNTSSKPINSDGLAYFQLFSGTQAGPVLLYAEIEGVRRDQVLNFTIARPEYAYFDPSIVIDSSETVSLTMHFIRDTGRISESQMIYLSYKALDTSGVSLSLPSSISLDKPSKVVQLKNPLGVKGLFEVEAKALNPNLDTVSAKALVEFR